MPDDRHDTARYAQQRRRLTAGLQLLPDKPEETVDTSLRALWHTAAGRPLSAVGAAETALPPLDEAGLQRLDTLIEQRLAGTPLAHISGRQRFVGLEMLAAPEALVPRRETEILARAAIDMAQTVSARANTVRVIDVCTGSGNIALAVAAHVPSAQISATDIDPAAIELARRNAEHLQLAHRIHFASGDLLQAFDDAEHLRQTDIVICNPPYISSSRVEKMDAEISGHEPHRAFDGGPLGVSILMRLIAETPRFLRSGGTLAFEVGLGQGPALIRRLQRNSDFSHVEGIADDQGAVRAIMAVH